MDVKRKLIPMLSDKSALDQLLKMRWRRHQETAEEAAHVRLAS
eukprot:CAMPEP_0175983982 /NCGR_PEP_ID=MMETSP0108-20121206/48763_1 /TAXON_ID=195067 ORGANISM="Goniomonas pacifica, Strain CCMP1869" /NCGR_SAMPLE_ID=MMETSP0108 /ASSEMBLY_ACC=CAM_ASM_000204 /LENGTH=42 /DNA_ID= /DNA_START= /DNA_END= /DNA_ORIENTATION=